MENVEIKSERSIELYRRAEEKVKQQVVKLRAKLGIDSDRLVRELEVRQIKLEIQNEELRRIRNELETIKTRYFDLYNFAPIAYLAINDKNLIVESNLTAAKLLCIQKRHLIGQKISRFIAPDFQYAFDLYMNVVNKYKTNQACELMMLKRTGITFMAQLTSIAREDKDNDRRQILIAISNINEIKKTEENLQKREKQYIEVARRVGLSFWERDFVSSSFFWAKETYDIFGVDAENFEPTYENFLRLVHPCDREPVKQKVQETLSSGKKQNIEYRIIRPDGEVRYIQSVSEVVWDKKGKTRGLAGIVQDITDHKIMEEVLRESELRFKLVTETIEDIFWMSTPGAKEMVYVSPSYEKIWGRSCESLYESPMSLIEIVHPEDRDRLLNICKEYHTHGKPYRCEYRIVPSEGKIKWILERGFPIFDENGKLLYMTGVCMDITTQKWAEEALRKSQANFLALIESTNDIIVSRDREGRAIVFNSSYARTLQELFAVEAKPGVRPMDYLPSEQNVRWENIFGKVLSGENYYEILTQQIDSEIRHYELSLNPIWSGGEVIGSAEFKRDITERKKVDDELREYQSKLKAMASQLSSIQEQERRKMAVELHDRVTQKLALTKLGLETLAGSVKDTNVVRNIKKNSEHIGSAIEDAYAIMVELSNPILYEIGIVPAVRLLLKNKFLEEHGISCKFISSGKLVKLDTEVRVALYQGIRESLTNIIKHANAKNVEIKIHRTSDVIRCTVKDDVSDLILQRQKSPAQRVVLVF